MKTCYKCKESKPISAFGKNRARKDGVHSSCKLCAVLEAAAYAKKNSEKVNVRNKKWRMANHDKYRASIDNWTKNNIGKVKEYQRVYNDRNPELTRFRNMKNRPSTRNATPCWLDEGQRFFMREIARLAVQRTRATSFEWHVDHIIPSHGKDVCGLNVPWNLQVIPGVVNARKGNRL